MPQHPPMLHEENPVDSMRTETLENNISVHPETALITEPEILLLTPEAYFNQLDRSNSRQLALNAVMGMWGEKNTIKPYLHDVIDDDVFFNLAAKQNGFLIYSGETDLDLIKKLNLPAILQLSMPEETSFFYLAIRRINGAEITLVKNAEENGVTIQTGDLFPFLGEKVYIPWKNFYNYSGVIPISSAKDAVMTLKMHLREIGFEELDLFPVYDKATKDIITLLQKKHGITEDGLVGPVTKIILYNEMESLNIPKIRD